MRYPVVVVAKVFPTVMAYCCVDLGSPWLKRPGQHYSSEFMEKAFQAAQLTHERFLTIDHSCKIFFFNIWTSMDLWCLVLYTDGWNDWGDWVLTVYHPHWDFLCSDRSNLELMRWWILVIVNFVGINSDKNTNWLTKIINLIWEIILMKMKISARWRHCSKNNQNKS